MSLLPTKLMALTEHSLRYESLLQIARALREQIEWDTVRDRTESSPFAHAFFVLAEGLDILPGGGRAGSQGGREPGSPRVRVVTPQGSGPSEAG